MKTLKSILLFLFGIISFFLLTPLFAIELLIIMPLFFIYSGEYYYNFRAPINTVILLKILKKIKVI